MKDKTNTQLLRSVSEVQCNFQKKLQCDSITNVPLIFMLQLEMCKNKNVHSIKRALDFVV